MNQEVLCEEWLSTYAKCGQSFHRASLHESGALHGAHRQRSPRNRSGRAVFGAGSYAVWGIRPCSFAVGCYGPIESNARTRM